VTLPCLRAVYGRILTPYIAEKDESRFMIGPSKAYEDLEEESALALDPEAPPFMPQSSATHENITLAKTARDQTHKKRCENPEDEPAAP